MWQHQFSQAKEATGKISAFGHCLFKFNISDSENLMQSMYNK